MALGVFVSFLSVFLLIMFSVCKFVLLFDECSFSSGSNRISTHRPTAEQRSFVNLSSRAPNAFSWSTAVAHCDHKMPAFSYVKPRALVFLGVPTFSDGNARSVVQLLLPPAGGVRLWWRLSSPD